VTADAPIVETSSGLVRGRSVDGVSTFTGIPYAKAPVGELRFAPPQSAIPWDGIRDALEPGPSAPQSTPNFAAIDLPPIIGTGWAKGDDYLTVNVWAPEFPAKSPPVMVWVHGGAFALGTKDATSYDGTNFARDGAVVVAMHYRLGIEGFVPIEGAPTNLGLRDIIFALEWVRDNVAAFGGDPGNVTVFGESAGGILVSCLLASPLAAGLFHRAIVQSGHGTVPSLEIGRRIAAVTAKKLGVANRREAFLAVPASELVAVLGRLATPGAVDMRDASGLNVAWGLASVFPYFGDDVLPIAPEEALARGVSADVDLLVMTTDKEVNFWFAPTVLRLMPRPLARLWLNSSHRDAGRILRTYAEVYPKLRGGMLLAAAMSDLAFRWPARRYAAKHGGRTWMANFDITSDAAGGRLGAAHGLDLPYVFDTLAVATGPKGFAGNHPSQSVATRLHQTWLRFARSGDPGWPEFDDETRLVYVVSAGTASFEAPLPAREFLDR
jgi:para-nitrobenzyl esterase